MKSYKKTRIKKEKIALFSLPVCTILECMHAFGKDLSLLAMPTCLKLTSGDVKEQTYLLATKGLTPSQISVMLRDSCGVAQVRFVTGNKILRILKS